MRLLQAGWDFLVETEPAELQIKALVEAAGVSRALFNKNFPSVSALLLELAGAGLATLLINVGEEEGFDEFAGAWIRFAEARPHHYALMWSPRFAADPRLSNRINELCRYISVRAQARLGREPTQSQVQSLLGIIHGAASIVAAGLPRQATRSVVEPIDAYLKRTP